ncbi:MAG: thiamine phosphate synthase [Syntrophales bacterium]|nr:thiamine phosphate synthase [Syntrophales bacterium]
MRQKPFIYLVLSEIEGNDRPLLSMARAAIEGGISWLQMRIKGKKRRELLPLGRALKALCQGAGVTFIVNDDPILARRLDADGVHLGQEDLLRFPVPMVRRILGRKKIIGVSTHSISEAELALATDIDYIAFGPLFPTPNKPYHIGLKDLPEVLARSTKPVVLIGGINMQNIDVLRGMGGKYFAMIRGILDADDIAGRVRELRRRLEI